MPRNFGGAGNGRPAHSRSATVPGPGNPGEDDLLKARQATLNTEPFTAEHGAAYAAFAGITERRTALDLHRHGVTWDDINDYCAGGYLHSSDFRSMKTLREAGVSPSLYSQWQDTAATHQAPSPTAEEIVLYARAGLSPTQIAPYMTHRPKVMRPARQVAVLAAAGVSPTQCQAWEAVGIHNADNIAYLVGVGCQPSTVTEYLSVSTTRAIAGTIERRFLVAYTALVKAAAGNPDLARTALLCAVSATELDQWVATGEPASRIRLYLQAGIGNAEWHDDPTVREADEATIAMLSALNGHTTTAPGQMVFA